MLRKSLSGDYGPTVISTKKKTISRTRRNTILAERERAMVCGVRKEDGVAVFGGR